METIEINGKSYLIDIEKATEQGLLKEKDNRPRSWEEYDKAPNSERITTRARVFNGKDYTYFDSFNSEDEAKAFCALGKLIQLRDAWCGDWKPDWMNSNSRKYVIYHSGGKFSTDFSYETSNVLAFPTQEMCDDFLETFRDLIEQAKMFL